MPTLINFIRKDGKMIHINPEHIQYVIWDHTSDESVLEFGGNFIITKENIVSLRNRINTVRDLNGSEIEELQL